MDPRDLIPYQRPNNGAGNLEKIASIRSKHWLDTERVKILKPEKVWDKYSLIDQAQPIVLRHD